MHEFSVASSLVAQVEREAAAHGAVRIATVSITVGEQCGVLPDFLATAWLACREGTVCAEARLSIEQVPARWACPGCGTAPAAGAALRCPDCAGPVALASGGELVLRRIELELP